MAASVDAGRVVELESRPTLSDGTAGGIEADAITFPLCRELVDQFIVVDEQDIAKAMRDYARFEGERIEGAAGVAIAAARQYAGDGHGDSAIVICGGNVSDATWLSIG